MEVEPIARIGDDRIRLDEVAEGRVIPPCAVVVQAQAGFFSLTRIAVAGGSGPAREAGGPEGTVTHFAGFSGPADGVGRGAQVVRKLKRQMGQPLPTHPTNLRLRPRAPISQNRVRNNNQVCIARESLSLLVVINKAALLVEFGDV